MSKSRETKFLQRKIASLEREIATIRLKDHNIREREEKYRTIFEKSRDAILIITNRVFTDCNQATVEMLGYADKDKFLNTKPSALSPEYQPDGKVSLVKANEMMDLAVEQGSHRFEWIHTKADGSTFPVEVLLTTISAKKDNELIHTIWRDISEHKKNQERIIESEKRFQALMQQAPAVIELYDLDGLQITANKAYEEFWGFSAETTAGNFNVLQSEEAQRTGLIEYVKRAYAGEVVIVPEYRFAPTGATEAGNKGPARWLSTKIYPIKNTDGKVENIVITHEDVTQQKMAALDLQFSEERFRSLVETTSDFIWEVDCNATYTYASPMVEEILGYPPNEVIGKTPFDLMPDFEREKIAETFGAIVAAERSFDSLENINLHRDGSLVVLETSGVPFFDKHGVFAGYRGIDRDITQRKKYENQLLLTESVFTNSIEGIAITDKHGTIQKVNTAFTDITGYTFDEALGQNPRILKSDKHDDEFYREMWRALLEDGQWSGEIWNRRKDGSVYPEWLSIAAIKTETGETTHFISVFHDITEKKLNEEKLEFLAFHDPLTRLPNRRLFYDRLKVSIATARRYEHKAALLYMDVDNFKSINDSYGHPFGDEILCRVKERIASICRQSDTFARYGGDEFVIVLNHISGSNEALEFSKRLVELFKEPFEINHEELFTSLSIGLAIFPDDGEDIVTLEKNADMALYRAKQEGKQQAFLFRKDLKDTLLRRSFLENSLRRSMHDLTSFHLVYQPKIDIRDNRIKGVEALLRWNIDGEFISPAEFIPIAEETNCIVQLGEWVIRTAMADIAALQQDGHPELSLSINLSAKQFKDSRLFAAIENIINQTNFTPTRLIFEITESVPTENIEEAIGIMERLNSMGVNLSLDDFGTGYSSLGYLKKFPLKELKIDRSFIQDIPHDQNDIAISRTIIKMAQNLGFDVVAEGVETPEQIEFLRQNECHIAQGYIFYKPLTIDALQNIDW